MKAILSLLVLIAVSFSLAQHDRANHSDHSTHTHTDPSFAEKEAEVMPFDLDRTLHIFQDTASGGIQKVIVNDESDQINIKLIREHLKKEAELFAQGLFNDPGYLHGDDMPGLEALKQAGADGRLVVEYKDIEAGGQIIYSSIDLSVVIALHLWFQAQVLDHGNHAVIGN